MDAIKAAGLLDDLKTVAWIAGLIGTAAIVWWRVGALERDRDARWKAQEEWNDRTEKSIGDVRERTARLEGRGRSHDR